MVEQTIIDSDEAPWIRTFNIDGHEVTDTTYRTKIIEHYTPVAGKTFIDIGAFEGYEARAMAYRGAKLALAIEGKEIAYQKAKAAQDYLKLPNHEVKKLDARKIDTFDLGQFDVTLCFGFLYHLQNPFNFLKRIKNVTKELLLLETHVAPDAKDPLLDKRHRRHLRGGVHSIYLDGGLFQGRFFPHLGDIEQTKGSLDAPWTFWLTADSVVKAVIHAGFYITDYYYELDALSPEPIKKWGQVQSIRFGRANTKIFLVAVPKDNQIRPVGKPVESVSAEEIVPATLPPEPLLERFIRVAHPLKKFLPESVEKLIRHYYTW
jgi:hypothetical protein